MLTKLAHFFLAGWAGKQQGIINRPPQAKSCRDVPPQVGDDCLLVYNNSIRSRVGSICRQGDIHDAIREPVGGSALVKDERRMRCIAKRNWRCLRGARFGVCHDGSYRFWEWNDDLPRAFCSSGSLTPSPRSSRPRRPTIAYSRVGTGRTPSAVPSSSNFPASHLRSSELGLIAQSYRAFSSPPLGRGAPQPPTSVDFGTSMSIAVFWTTDGYGPEKRALRSAR